jgi:hypothetical protein
MVAKHHVPGVVLDAANLEKLRDLLTLYLSLPGWDHTHPGYAAVVETRRQVEGTLRAVYPAWDAESK